MTDDDAKYYRKPWMSDAQWECAQLFALLQGGFHHVGSDFKPAGRGIEINEADGGRWATFDFDRLTAAVFAAHDHCIRIEISSSGPRRLRFYLHKRDRAASSMMARHPTLARALETWRKYHPDPDASTASTTQ